MKQLFIVLGGLAIIVIGVVGYRSLRQPPEPASQQASPAQSKTPTNGQPQQPSTTTSVGQYIDYTPTSITSTAGTKILFFHAPWCPQCRALDASIKASTIPANVTIIKVDYDTHQALRQQYGVTLQTTLVRVDDQGGLIEKVVAYDEPTFHTVEQLLN